MGSLAKLSEKTMAEAAIATIRQECRMERAEKRARESGAAIMAAPKTTKASGRLGPPRASLHPLPACGEPNRGPSWPLFLAALGCGSLSAENESHGFCSQLQ
jgi:hypothetical protein